MMENVGELKKLNFCFFFYYLQIIFGMAVVKVRQTFSITSMQKRKRIERKQKRNEWTVRTGWLWMHFRHSKRLAETKEISYVRVCESKMCDVYMRGAQGMFAFWITSRRIISALMYSLLYDACIWLAGAATKLNIRISTFYGCVRCVCTLMDSERQLFIGGETLRYPRHERCIAGCMFRIKSQSMSAQ